jgi:hypothetical protein
VTQPGNELEADFAAPRPMLLSSYHLIPKAVGGPVAAPERETVSVHPELGTADVAITRCALREPAIRPNLPLTGRADDPQDKQAALADATAVLLMHHSAGVAALSARDGADGAD